MKKSKRILSVALVTSMMMSAAPVSALAATTWSMSKVSGSAFSDVVKEKAGISLNLTGSSITRENAANAIYDALGIDVNSSAIYSDIGGLNATSINAIGDLAEMGIIYGYPDGSFKPNKELTISEAEVLADRIADVFDREYNNGILQTVENGTVAGYKAEEDGAYVWKGIPYAQAPVGELRWKSPVESQDWEGILDATEYGEIGIQVSSGNIVGSEDCLNLDIYRPATDETNLPVMLFIHGGNNQTGQSNNLEAEILAREANAIVISSNFRLGALGFNCLPALKTGDPLEDSGNYTLLDIALSLDWIKENIASFGGDGENITVSGFSSGGRDVMAMLISPIFEGKFQKAITYSAGMTTSNVEDAIKVYAKAFSPLVVEDGIKETEEAAYEWLMEDKKEVADYLYSVSADRIARLMAGADIRMSVFPHLFEDGYVIPVGAFDTATYHNVPLMMFTASQEFSLFGLRSSFIKSRVEDGSIFTDETTRAEAAFISNYGSDLFNLFNAQESAERMFDKYNSPIYTCWVEWGNDAEIVGENMAVLRGSGHGINLPIMSGKNLNFAATYKDSFTSDGYKDLSYKFMEYTGNFMRNGNPNGNGLVEWEPWTDKDTGVTHLVLDADKDKAIFYMTEDRIVYEDVLKAMDEDTTISEASKKAIMSTVLNGRWFSARLDQYYGNESLWIK